MKVTPSQILARCVRRQCPNCGAPLRFSRWMRLQPACPQCGQRWARGDGFYLGAMVWNYAVTVFGLMGPVAIAFVHGWIALAPAVGLGLAIGLIFPWIFYKWSWAFWLASYYAVLPHELLANTGDDHTEVNE